MSGTGRKIIYVMLVIVVLLIIWQFLGSLWSSARRSNDRVRRLRFSDVTRADEAGSSGASGSAAAIRSRRGPECLEA